MAARQKQSPNAPVMGYSAGYQVPLSASDNGPYGSPPGYPTAGPPYSYSPGSSMYSSPRGYEDSQRGGSRSSPTQRTPNRAPPRGSSIAATDFGSEDEYPSESSDDDRRRPVRRPISRRDEGDNPSESDSGYPTSEEEERGDRRRGDDRQSSSAQPETQSSQSNAAASSMIDTLCIAQGIAPYPVGPGVGQVQSPGASIPPPVSDAPPAYSDI
ncbi:hypothetical protein FRC04_012174 [Tulasnella sp. 424]|nr:hypothetical protein FRC04_012174 [Tulasnella sp. 424]KAG8970943.1 hypothetical protein FRC05_011617 [Tulasnella sp. 425]